MEKNDEEKEQHKLTPLWRTAGLNKESGCLYDELFNTVHPEAARTSVEKVFQGVVAYVERNYGEHLTMRDQASLSGLQSDESASLLKLLFIVAVLTHDPAIRSVVEEQAEEQLRPKCRGFYRAMAIAMRSLYQSPYRPDNVQQIILEMIEFLHRAWVSCDAEACEHYCDIYAQRPRQEEDIDKAATATAEWIVNESAKKKNNDDDDTLAERIVDLCNNKGEGEMADDNTAPDI